MNLGVELGATAAENNALPLVAWGVIAAAGFALEAVDKGLLAYDVYRLQQAVADGDDELAADIGADLAIAGGTEIVIGIVPGSILGTKLAQKILDKVDDTKAAEVISDLGNKTQEIAHNYLGSSRQFWKADPIEFNGNKVFQRDDIFDLNYVDDRSRSNLQRMQKGLAPIGKDGESINLHHMLQTEDGPIAEVTQTFHQKNTKTLHINSGSGIPSGIDRNAFDAWKKQYWKTRAKDFE